MKLYLCVENGDYFTIKAESLEKAVNDCKIWGAKVVKEIEKLEDNKVQK